ncbi:MAG: hypothetical protein QM658_08255 [Gordonia sp. (in: high G+C Gram-positive bacteria)]
MLTSIGVGMLRPEPSGETDRRRIQLLMTRLVAAGYLAYSLLFLRVLLDRTQYLPWFAPVALVLVAGPGVVMGLTTLMPGDQWHRRLPALAVLCSVGFVLAVIAWGFGRAPGFTPGPQEWLMEFGGMAPLAMILVAPLRTAMIALIVGKGLAAVVSAAPFHGDALHVVLIEALFGFAFVTIFLLVVNRVLQAGEVLESSRAGAVAASTANVLAVERARIDALVHDRVIATLVSATPGPVDLRLARQARDALDELESLSEPHSGADSVAVPALLTRLREAVVALDADASFTVETAEGATPDARVPGAAASALVEASCEALRNSLRHAGPGAGRAVLAGFDDDGGLQVMIVDDGVGFDPAAVSRQRLGIELSIRQRLGLLSGGAAEVISEPGRGTTILLSWAAQNSAAQDSAADAGTVQAGAAQ